MVEERDPNLPYDPKEHPFPRMLHRLTDTGYETKEVANADDEVAAKKQGWRNEHPEVLRQKAADKAKEPKGS